jgi:hypothetical protein
MLAYVRDVARVCKELEGRELHIQVAKVREVVAFARSPVVLAGSQPLPFPAFLVYALISPGSIFF